MIKKFPMNDLLEETKLAIDAAIRAGKVVMEIYNTDFASKLKTDTEPVTEADIKSNSTIKETLFLSKIPIISEEDVENEERRSFEKLWIVDPLDGTTDFVNKTGEFTIMIALVENKKPVLGVIYWPTNDILYLAQKGHGVFELRDGVWTKLSVSNISKLSQCRVVGSRYHISSTERKLLDDLNVTKFTSKGSSLKVADICLGNAELYFTTTDKIKQWDTCASYCLITEAGGKMTDMLGNDLQYNTEILNHRNGILVTNGLIHDKIIEIYRKRTQ